MNKCLSCKVKPIIRNPYFEHLKRCFDCLQTWKKRQRRISRAKKWQVLARDNWRCVYCNTDLREVEYNIDHKKPVDDGGTGNLENLQATCEECNALKGTLSDAEFRKEWFKQSPSPIGEQGTLFTLD